MKSSSMNFQLRKPTWQHSLVTLMQLGQPKNVIKVTQVFLQCTAVIGLTPVMTITQVCVFVNICQETAVPP